MLSFVILKELEAALRIPTLKMESEGNTRLAFVFLYQAKYSSLQPS